MPPANKLRHSADLVGLARRAVIAVVATLDSTEPPSEQFLRGYSAVVVGDRYLPTWLSGLKPGSLTRRRSTNWGRRSPRTDVMTAREVAELLSLPVSTVYELARRGVLPCARLGRTIRFVRDEIEAVLHRSGASRGDL